MFQIQVWFYNYVSTHMGGRKWWARKIIQDVQLYPYILYRRSVQKDPARPMLGSKNQNMFTIFFYRIYLLWAPKSYGQRRLHCCSARIKAAFLKLWELEWSLYVQYPAFHVISLLYSTMKNMHFQQGQLLIHCMLHTGNCAHMPSASGGIW